MNIKIGKKLAETLLILVHTPMKVILETIFVDSDIKGLTKHDTKKKQLQSIPFKETEITS